MELHRLDIAVRCVSDSDVSNGIYRALERVNERLDRSKVLGGQSI